ncbi:MAG: Cytochrome [Bacteroidetes bacterium]|nr:Cytochrome [Bacteroidota bacterium]
MIVLFLFSWHMWRVRKDGGLAVVDHEVLEQRAEKVAPVKSKTYSLLGITQGTTVHVRIWLVTLLTFVVSVILTIAFRAPLETAANPSVTPNPAKAPWYFLWLQEIVTDTTLKLGSFTINGALIGGILLPGVLVLLALWWPYRDKSGINAVGVWFAPERKRQNMVFLLICLFIIVFTIIGTFLRGPYWNFYWPWESWPEMPVKF